MYEMVDRNYKKYVLKNCTYVNHQTRLQYLNSLIRESDVTCVSQLRMNRRTFGILYELLRTIGGVKNDGSVTVEEQAAMFDTFATRVIYMEYC